MTITMAPNLLVAFLLCLVRASAWLAFAPPFANKSIPPTVKVGLAMGLSISVASGFANGPHASQLQMDNAGFISAVVLQAATGVALGFISSLLFQAIASAGGFIDIASGLSSASAFDPLSGVVNPVTQRTFNLISTTLLFATGADLLLVKGFMTSFQAFGLTNANLHVLSLALIQDISLFFLSALEIAAPLLGVLFLSNVALGLLTRAAPQLNVMTLGFAVNILLTLVLLGTTLPLLPGAVSTLVDHGIRDALGVLGIGT